jgi:rhodanese-related sulfurtransferase
MTLENILSREHLKIALTQNKIQLIDVREPHEYAAGHVAEALSLPLSFLQEANITQLQQQLAAMSVQLNAQTVLMCGAGIRSLKALDILQSHGFEITTHYKGGYRDWIMAGETVVTA